MGFKEATKFSNKSNKKGLGDTYQHIIQYSELLLLSTFDYILDRFHKNVGENIGKRAKTAYNLLSFNNEQLNIKTSTISNRKERNHEKSKQGYAKLVKGLQDIIKKYSQKMKITRGVSSITDDIAILRSTTSDVHTQTIAPTKEEAILALNVSSNCLGFCYINY